MPADSPPPPPEGRSNASTSSNSRPSWVHVRADALLVARRIAELITAGRELHGRGWVAANEGNLSCRLDSQSAPAADAAPSADAIGLSALPDAPVEVLCTATGVSKGRLRPEDFCVVEAVAPPLLATPSAAAPGRSQAGPTERPPINQIAGVRPVTSEVRMHLAIYAADPTIRAVVHCHPPCATAWAVGDRPVPPGLLPEIDLFVGPEIPRAPFVEPGTWEFAETVRPLARRPEISAVLLTRHGLVTWGTSVQQALWRTEIVEAYLRTLLFAKSAERS